MCLTYIHSYIDKDRQTDKQTDRQRERERDRKTDRLASMYSLNVIDTYISYSFGTLDYL